MKISFYLNEARQKNLYCRISDGSNKLSFSLGKAVKQSDWDEKESMPKSSKASELYYDLKEFKDFLEKKYFEFKSKNNSEKVLQQLKQEAFHLLNASKNTASESESNLSEALIKLRDMKHSHPTENYLKAFMLYSGAKKKDIQYKNIYGHIAILYKDITYMVSHRDDLRKEYQYYFENKSYIEIGGGEIPSELWSYFLKEILELPVDELIIALYHQWQIYWGEKKAIIGGEKERYERLRRQSWESLQILISTIQFNSQDIVKNAESIGDELIPLIAFVIYDQYEDHEEKFYDECMDWLTENGEDFLTCGETFEDICIEKDSNNEDDFDSDEWYYIYNPLFEFND